MRNQLCWNFHILLLGKHLPDFRLIVIGSVVAGFGTLPQAIVSLRVEQTAFVKAPTLELVVNVGGQHKIILVLHQCQQLPINGKRGIHIAVIKNVTAPPGPVFLQRVIGIKSPGVHIGDAVFSVKIGEVPFKPFPAVGEAGRGG